MHALSEAPVIGLDMLNLYKYIPLICASGITTRALVYPFSLIKTRIQAQTQTAVYNGTLDAFGKIIRKEGVRGLYRGLLSQNAQIIPGIVYIWTYENVRQLLSTQEKFEFLHNRYLLFGLGGASAAIAGQTLGVPVDNVVQYRQLGHKTKKTHMKALPPEVYKQSYPSLAIIQHLWRSEGPLALWKGYFATLSMVIPSSALWWWIYGYNSDILTYYLSAKVPMTGIQCGAGLSAGICATCVTNVLDIIRLRIQTERKTYIYTARTLWKEEGMSMFYKGLSARLAHSLPFSFTIIFLYESIKKFSVKEEFKDKVKW
ncbi:solute carrier family 25 member 44 [Lingula anatina]|uniref:Solute carrier family 25 member 44 n=1 Tax=Lingula anatina TaxID=7574 RepID=A0A1S3JHE3_LINAN|nr:solute carrier family 25 member 44 [Lingula anatina]XP_013409779.1 solute carrier family 25 member 44 [Lingula anatina]XP_013409780.1 solute carrier family 25 member 44 [Lingula anatina]|eukprot:XP_013409778.1 solute carrier family 25 member 44 [Lingula anatina]